MHVARNRGLHTRVRLVASGGRVARVVVSSCLRTRAGFEQAATIVACTRGGRAFYRLQPRSSIGSIAVCPVSPY